MAIDPVPAGLLAQGGMGLLSGLLGGRAQKRQDRQNDRRQAMGNLQQSLGGGNQRPVAGMGGRTPGVMEGMLSDPVTQQLLQQLMAGKGGQGGDLFKWLQSKLGGAGVSAAAKTASGGGGRRPSLGGGLEMGNPYQTPLFKNPSLQRPRLG